MTSTTLAAQPPQTTLRRRRPPRHLLPPRARLLVLWLLFAFGSTIFVVFFTDVDRRLIYTPLLLVLNVALFYFAVLYARDGELPVFEAGSLWVASTAVYSTFPLMNFLVSGLRWRHPSDWRLVGYDPTPQQMGAYAWNHVIYMATFVVAYLILRGGKRVPRVFEPVSRMWQTAVIITFAVMFVLVSLVQIAILPPEASISPYEGGDFAYRANVPHVVLQFLNIGNNALLALKLLFAILLLSRWREPKWRLVLFLWLPLELLIVTRSLSRAPFVLLLLTIGISYHRLVRPIALRTAVACGVTLLTAFLAFGVYRDTRGRGIDLKTALVTNNEFQGLFANGYDIKMRRHYRAIRHVPPQLPWSELYMVVPSQLLPFEKLEPGEWYAEVLDIKHTGIRTMFGIMAQAMLGYGTLEVFLRGLACAVLLSLLHRWYVRRAARFWPTAIYAYLIIWTYYMFRASTLAPLYFVVYYFGSAAFLVAAVKFALAGQRRKAVAPGR